MVYYIYPSGIFCQSLLGEFGFERKDEGLGNDTYKLPLIHGYRSIGIRGWKLVSHLGVEIGVEIGVTS